MSEPITNAARKAILAKGLHQEGALKYTSDITETDFEFTQEEADAIIDTFFEGKTPPTAEDQIAIILLGGPGSGKSFVAREQHENLHEAYKAETIYVSYDETGAIFAIPDYKDALVKILGDHFDEHEPIDSDLHEDLKAHWDNYRKFSQYIRTGILERALEEGFSVTIDTTSSSQGVLKMIDLLRELKVPSVEVQATYAPFDASIDRLHHRIRPASDEEAITKRIGALNMIPYMMAAADHFDLHYNPRNDGKKPALLLHSHKNGENIAGHIPDIIKAAIQNMEADTAKMVAFSKEIGISRPDLDRDIWEANHEFSQLVQRLTKPSLSNEHSL